MEKKKKTMQDYIELTPDMIRKNVQKNEELTKVLVDEFNRDHFDSILIIASGSSYNASMGARPFLKKITKMNVDVITPFTFEHYENEFYGNPFVVVVSQSGCSTNSISALKKLKAMRHRAIGITSNVNSDFGDGICDVVVDYGIGIETVGYVTLGMVGLVLYFMLFALNVARGKTLTEEKYTYYLEELNKAAQCHEDVQNKVKDFYELNKRNLLSMQNCYVVGMGPNFGTALEGALKFSETIQVVSVAYELEEFLHGPNFQLTPNYTLFFIDNEDETSDRLLDIYEGYSTVTDRCFIISNSERIQGDHVLRIDDLTCEDVSMLYKVVVFEYLAYKVTTDLNKWQYHPLAKVVEDTIIKIKSSKYKEGYDKL